jgi:hypothetical protein
MRTANTLQLASSVSFFALCPSAQATSSIDGSDPNGIDIISTKLTGNDFVDEKCVGLSISGTVSDDTNSDDTGNVNLEGVMVMLRDCTATSLPQLPPTAAWQFPSSPAHGNYSSVTDTTLGNVPLDVNDGDGSNPNGIAIIMLRVGMKLTGSAFVNEKSPVHAIGSISGNVSKNKDKNSDDISDND